MMELVGARALLVQHTYLAELGDLLSSWAPELAHVVVTGSGDVPVGGIAYDDLVAAADAADPAVPIAGSDPYIIRFPAGTTGRSKGILHTYDGWAAMGQEFTLALPRFDETDSYLVAGPLSHAACLLSWPMMTYGVRQVVMPKFDPLVPPRRTRTGDAVAAGPDDDPAAREPPRGRRPGPVEPEGDLLRGVADHRADAGRLRPALWGPIMHQLYGQSETPAITVLPARPHRPDGTAAEQALLRSAGRPTPNVEVRILDDDGNAMGVGAAMWPWPRNMRGIWGDPDATVSTGDERRAHPHEGHRLSRRPWLPAPRRPQRGPDHLGRVQRLARRGRGRPLRPPRRPRGCRGRRPRREVGGDRPRRGRGPRRPHRHGRRADQRPVPGSDRLGAEAGPASSSAANRFRRARSASCYVAPCARYWEGQDRLVGGA